MAKKGEWRAFGRVAALPREPRGHPTIPRIVEQQKVLAVPGDENPPMERGGEEMSAIRCMEHLQLSRSHGVVSHGTQLRRKPGVQVFINVEACHVYNTGASLAARRASKAALWCR